MDVEESGEWELAGETEVLGENLPRRNFVHHKTYMAWPRLEPGPPRWDWHGLTQQVDTGGKPADFYSGGDRFECCVGTPTIKVESFCDRPHCLEVHAGIVDHIRPQLRTFSLFQFIVQW
jgi:hypothetical protein